MDLGLRRAFTWTLVRAAVSRSIIGADFLHHYRLLVDVYGRRLLDGLTGLSTPAAIVTADSYQLNLIDTTSPYADILKQFPAITKPFNFSASPSHPVVHHLETTGPPLYCRARPIPPKFYKLAKAEFQNMTELGICRPSNSPWANPLHIVTKKNGEIRPCGDYKRLNAKTQPDRYSLPRITDFQYILPGKTIFSHIDIARAYHNIPMASEDVAKTAIITPFGLFEFTRMPFGLRNAAQTFQRFLDNIFRDLDYVFCYIDDLLIASTPENHEQHLQEVFRRLQDNGLTINVDKCQLGQPSLTFLGYHVDTEGIRPPADRVQAILEYPRPTDTSELRRFLGSINFFRACLPHAAEYLSCLYKQLEGKKKNDRSPINWDDTLNSAFVKCRTALAEATTLSHPVPDADLQLMTDASLTCIGATLLQMVNGKPQPLGFFSKSLTPAQQRYSTYDRELLAIRFAIKHFRRLIEGRPCTILTDHKPLTFAFNKPSSPSETPLRQRYLDYISQFTTDIRFIEGSSNSIADSLSRIAAISVPTTLDYAAIAKAQNSDSELDGLRKNDKYSFLSITLPDSTVPVTCEVSTGRARPYIPQQFRRPAYESVHNLSHPGTRMSRKTIASRFFWPSMNKDIADWTRTCDACQRSKIHRHTKPPLGTFPAAERFEHVHIDLVGPLPSCNGYQYLLTCIDRATRWPEAIAIRDITATTVADAFYKHWISRFGCPLRLTTDQGRQFESTLFHRLTQLLGCKRIHTTAYHPQANGAIERWHRSLKTSLTAHLTDNWVQTLPTVLLGLRSMMNDSGTTPAQLVYGTELRLPGDFFSPPTTIQEPNDFLQELRNSFKNESPEFSTNRTTSIFIPKDLTTTSHVFIRNDLVQKPLTPAYSGPYPVLDRTPHAYKIKMPGKEAFVSIQRLKPAYSLPKDSLPKPNAAPPAQTTLPAAAFLTGLPSPSTANTATSPPPATSKFGRPLRPTVRFAFP